MLLYTQANFFLELYEVLQNSLKRCFILIAYEAKRDKVSLFLYSSFLKTHISKVQRLYKVETRPLCYRNLHQ